MAIHQIIDRRGSKNKSLPNVRRYLRREQAEMWEAAREAIKKYNIADKKFLDADITFTPKNTKEPVFRHAPGGRRETVHPGNQEYVKGDRNSQAEGRRW